MLTKKECSFSVHFLYIFNFYKSLKQISDEWLIVICWSSPLFGIFIIKMLNLGTLKHDCVIKTSKIVSFLPVINSLHVTGLSFLLLITLAITSSQTINTLYSYPGLQSPVFL